LPAAIAAEVEIRLWDITDLIKLNDALVEERRTAVKTYGRASNTADVVEATSGEDPDYVTTK
jgi:hypothetical protein